MSAREWNRVEEEVVGRFFLISLSKQFFLNTFRDRIDTVTRRLGGSIFRESQKVNIQGGSKLFRSLLNFNLNYLTRHFDYCWKQRFENM